ncbi:C45 family autoproteolytic acyltransferase/hydolase [Nonomuraea typhae]|uniref:C45 family autoproteolytic acyltransferase/hydrolase n=1 Tax=Nonomuraea typhae TaxID=2603600 RepID=A0ABW7YLA1_9ACTN
MDITQIAGGRDDFQLVRHIQVSGSQAEIGGQLAEEARRLGWRPAPVDPQVGRARRSWFAAHWPQHHARMTGAALALGLDPEQDDLTLDGLSMLPQACSALWVPPAGSADGHGRIGRNYDFFTLTTSEIMGGPPAPGELPMASRPHVITSRPDDGLASTVLTMSEFDGCMDGINEAGLAVVLLIADFETATPPEDLSPQTGVNSVQLPRFLLDTCESAEQAKAALLRAEQYDFGTPLHYLVADASGQAFVWEGPDHVAEAGDGPLCVTNHLLRRHPDPAALPEDTPGSFGSFSRLRSLHERSKGAIMSAGDLRASLLEAEQAGDPTMRTLWSTQFDTAARTMTARFYLGEGRGHSPELVFSPSA